ncbi:mucin-binding lectin 1 [Coprinopsis sp. MPI-PUGE-AT-0042]|nr:mucin-binding lectin 1 [Coprinopsis sp. MPI-PUGE-AT-0042]
MVHIFLPGMELSVITHGPGTLQLLSYECHKSLTPNISTVRTENLEISAFIVAAAFTYTRFALVWTGEGQAFYQIGDSQQRHPLGRDWKAASTIAWGSNSVGTGDVSAIAQTYLKPDMRLGGTIYAVPKNLYYP